MSWSVCGYWKPNFKNCCLQKSTWQRVLCNKTCYLRPAYSCTQKNMLSPALWCREHQWGNTILYIIMSLRVCAVISREPGIRYLLSDFCERLQRFDVCTGYRHNFEWAHIPLYVWQTLDWCEASYDILVPYVCLFMDSVISDFILMDYNARPERTHLVDEFLKIENICLMDWQAGSPY